MRFESKQIISTGFFPRCCIEWTCFPRTLRRYDDSSAACDVFARPTRFKIAIKSITHTFHAQHFARLKQCRARIHGLFKQQRVEFRARERATAMAWEAKRGWQRTRYIFRSAEYGEVRHRGPCGVPN